jgi:hypothetical protein
MLHQVMRTCDLIERQNLGHIESLPSRLKCLLGGKKASASGTVKTSFQAFLADFLSDTGCQAKVVSLVTNLLQLDESNFSVRPSTSR